MQGTRRRQRREFEVAPRPAPPRLAAGPKRPRPPPRPKLGLSTDDLGRLRAEEEARAVLLAEKARLTQERLEAAIRRVRALLRPLAASFWAFFYWVFLLGFPCEVAR